MKGRFTVGGSWVLDVDLREETGGAVRGSVPYSTVGVDKMARRLSARSALFRTLERPETVTELFGGMGLCSTVIRGLWNPSRHRVFEINPGLAAHLLSNRFIASCVDSYKVARTLSPQDLLDVDFGLFTVGHLRDRETSLLISDIFSPGHRSIVMTDHAMSRFGAHKELYGTVLRETIFETTDYYEAWSREFFERYGYSIRRAFRSKGSTYVLWEKGEPHRLGLIHPEADPDFVRWEEA